MEIYLACFPGGFKAGDVLGYALAKDGTGLASHLSSNADFSKHDMGFTSEWKHEHYAKAYPEGYKLIWIDDPENDQRWQEAKVLNDQQKGNKT